MDAAEQQQRRARSWREHGTAAAGANEEGRRRGDGGRRGTKLTEGYDDAVVGTQHLQVQRSAVSRHAGARTSCTASSKHGKKERSGADATETAHACDLGRSQEEFEERLRTSTTVYVGNLSFYTTEEQIHEVFSRCGELKRIVMGLDSVRKVPCGFCFVVYYTRDDTEDCVKYLNGTVLDERPIRVDFDWGYVDGRQFGRGRSGGQVRDEFRVDYDAGRGGYGHWLQQEAQQAQGGVESQETTTTMVDAPEAKRTKT